MEISCWCFYKWKLKEIMITHIFNAIFMRRGRLGMYEPVSFHYTKVSCWRFMPLISCEKTDKQTSEAELLLD